MLRHDRPPASFRWRLRGVGARASTLCPRHPVPKAQQRALQFGTRLSPRLPSVLLGIDEQGCVPLALQLKRTEERGRTASAPGRKLVQVSRLVLLPCANWHAIIFFFACFLLQGRRPTALHLCTLANTWRLATAQTSSTASAEPQQLLPALKLPRLFPRETPLSLNPVLCKRSGSFSKSLAV